ncbi:hypothetical protein AMAG_14726 [Allomyces macrogynus ATCC 38327]|uniref:Peptidase S9A N-terminal domain-containing protein n=1 Tax=Allomyces macrogynus (strain ATCC 38327) TaxID=578462 RepID=A0A0L0T5N2_ALLM3|nr:hypothetical protein AMAG_14726 [Allomyces macrogynus ATCC 38327]|eukprot:KNE69879.1 hypothetical protein AMAG_14726 [Allomyces macrogynus ATCC 38327]
MPTIHAWRDPARTVFLPNVTSAAALSPSLPRDPYAWIADSAHAGDVGAYITKEHGYREAETAHLAPLRATLVQELTAVEPLRRTGTAQVVDNDTASIFEVSPNGTFAAVTFDPTGWERQFVRVWPISDQQYLCNGTAFLDFTADTMRWGNDTTLYVPIMDEVTVPRGVVRVDVAACSTDARRVLGGPWIVFQAQGQVTTQTHLVLAGADRIVPLTDTETGAMTDVVVGGNDLLVRTNRAGADWYEVRRVPGAVARLQSLPNAATALVTD